MSGRAYAHFIGVGGAGMSGIALVLHGSGAKVTGSDMKDSRYLAALRDAGMTVHVGHDAGNLGEPEVVVVSTAIPEDNPELAAARERGIEVWPRARMLAHLAGERRTVAVAGTHGKTTTSSMIAWALSRIGADPTFLIGGELNDMGANAHTGAGDHYVVEADESDGSFLFMEPYLAVVTNVEADHLDHYTGGIDEIQATFERFVERVREDGVAVLCADDPRALALAGSCAGRVVTYGRTDGADVRVASMSPSAAGHAFEVAFPDGTRISASVSVPGEHMALNATGALAAVWALGLDVAGAAEALAAFGGVRRRFEAVGEAAGVHVVDDYAHHPTEVRATLAGARQVGEGRVWVVFQPHRYSRTSALADDFGASFDDADRLVLMDVYSAGEAPIPGVTGKAIVDAVLERRPHARVAYLPHRADVRPYVAARVRPGDLVLTMGAGDVTALGPEIVHGIADVAGGGPRCP